MAGQKQPQATFRKFFDENDQIKKLGELHKAGVLTDEEFAAKKTELLKRL